MGLYLAMDGGGTKTRCTIADETRVLAWAATGSVKLTRVAEAEATARLNAMLTEVEAQAGVSLSQVTRTCFGLAGVSIAAVREWAQRSISAAVGGELIVCGDEEIALDAAFAGGPGILVVAGTGTNAIGRSASGELAGVGGWGHVLGDEGSGYWIGLEAVRAALRARDRTGATGLLDAIRMHRRLGSVAELVAWGNGSPDFAELAPVVARCAAQGDSLAESVLVRAGQELAELVSAVYCKMPAREGGSGIDIAYAGSIIEQIKEVRDAMVARLAAVIPAARVGDAAVDPLDGALWRARRG